MNAKTKKQLKVYTGLVVATLIADKANGQIVYHDIAPDDTMFNRNHGSLFYDFNNDGEVDVAMYQTSWLIGSAGSDPRGNAIYISEKLVEANLIQGCTIPMQHVNWLNKNDTIPTLANGSNFQSWVKIIDAKDSYSGSLFYNCIHFNAAPNVDYYASIKFEIAGQAHYAWMRMELQYDTIHNGRVIIKDYAYNSIANAPIIAGDTLNASLGLNAATSSFEIFAQHHNIKIKSTKLIENANVKIYDLIGIEIYSQIFSGNEVEIPVDKKGIYIVEVVNNNIATRKKIFIY